MDENEILKKDEYSIEHVFENDERSKSIEQIFKESFLVQLEQNKI